MLGNSVAFRDPSPSGEAYVTLAGASTGQGNESFGEKGSTRRKPSIEDLSFKSAKSLADSMCDDDSFTRSKSTNAFNVAANTNSRLLRSQNTVRNLLSYQTAASKLAQSAKTRREERADFVEHVARTRKQLKGMHRLTLNPHSRFIRWWDVATLWGLMVTIFITPWEVSFLPPTRLASDDWEERPITFVVNRLVDCIFVLDMILAFFLPYRTKRTGMWVYDNKRIVHHVRASDAGILHGPSHIELAPPRCRQQVAPS